MLHLHARMRQWALALYLGGASLHPNLRCARSAPSTAFGDCWFLCVRSGCIVFGTVAACSQGYVRVIFFLFGACYGAITFFQ